jgi:DNA segregation ATPase FtsK/SpoIIIE, S-DNA-T family
MKRGRKRKLKVKLKMKTDSVKSVIAVVLFLLWLVSFIAFIAPSYVLNEKVHDFWRGLFGGVALFAPMLLLLPALFLVDSIKTRFKEPRIIVGLVLMYTCIVGISHLFIPQNEAFKAAEAGEGGGMLGFQISSFLIHIVSIYGAIAVLSGLLVTSAIILFDVSLDQVIHWITETLGKSGIFAKLRGGKKEELEDEIEINSGGSYEEDSEEPVSVDDSERLAKKQEKIKKEKEADQDFAFEIVPSLSEPIAQDRVLGDDVVSTLITGGVQPALPYTDKVWKNPPLDLLSDYEETSGDGGDTEGRARKIKDTLRSFGVEVEIADTKVGPSVTQYQLRAESGVKISKITSYEKDLALALASPTGSVRIEAPIPGKALIGIEVPNNTRATVGIKSLLMSEAMKGMKSRLGITLGKDVAGRVFAYDIGKMPHMLIAGTTGSGKSIFIHNTIFSILFRATPQEVKLILVDPKRVELIHYADIPHLLTPVVTEMSKAPSVFKWAVEEMERRYKMFEQARVRNVEGYNEKSGFQALPYIVIIVEELGEIMQVDPQGVEKSIIRIAQLARATGIHLVLSVQRPSTNIVTGLIKANIPCRIAFNVMSQIDSRVIIDQPGAEKLLGKGDMLFIPPDASKPTRLQAAMVTDKEIATVVNYLKSQGVPPDYRPEVLQAMDKPSSVNAEYGGNVDELFDQAVEIVTMAGKASASLLQRKLSIGYARAARIIDELEQNGIVGPGDGSKPRDVLFQTKDRLNQPTSNYMNGIQDEPEGEVNSIQEQ